MQMTIYVVLLHMLGISENENNFLWMILLYDLSFSFSLAFLNRSCVFLADRRILLHFEAVDSAFFAWINGNPVGYRCDICSKRTNLHFINLVVSSSLVMY